MTNVKRITLITVCLAAILPGNGLWAQQTEATGTTQTADSVSMPAQWDLQSCINYALQQNISIRRNRINAQSTQVDVKTAKAALFPSLSFSSSQNLVNRPLPRVQQHYQWLGSTEEQQQDHLQRKLRTERAMDRI